MMIFWKDDNTVSIDEINEMLKAEEKEESEIRNENERIQTEIS